MTMPAPNPGRTGRLPSGRIRRGLRLTFSLAAAAVLLAGLRQGLRLMQDRAAVEGFLLRLFDSLGVSNDIVRLTEGGLAALTGKLALGAIAVVVGVGGVWALFWVAHDLVNQLPYRWRERVMPFVFVGPAIALLAVYLIFPVFNTILTSLSEDIAGGPQPVAEPYSGSETIAADLAADSRNVTFDGYLLDLGDVEAARVRVADRAGLMIVRPGKAAGAQPEQAGPGLIRTVYGLHNYAFAFTSEDMHVAFRNNVVWLVVCTGLSVVLGLFTAALVDRVRYESAAKSIIFMPLAISFVGASVIWRFVYAWQPAGRPQIGLLNAVVTALGGEPVAWLVESPLNTFALILAMIWLQTGFCMIVLSAALKGMPHEIVEAARIDGASELQVFFRVTIPMIRGSILTVGTTVFIATLKVFDIVYVMTGGRFDTEVIANRMFIEMFTFRNFGRASSLAVLLLVVVIPIMVINVRNLRRQGINA